MKQQIYKDKEQKKKILSNLIGQQEKVNMLYLSFCTCHIQ